MGRSPEVKSVRVSRRQTGEALEDEIAFGCENGPFFSTQNYTENVACNSKLAYV